MAIVNDLNQSNKPATGNFMTGTAAGSAPPSMVGGQRVQNLAAAPAQQNSIRFPNLEKYINANQGVGQQLGQQVQSNINQQAQAFQQGVNKAQGNLAQQTNQANRFFQNVTAQPNQQVTTQGGFNEADPNQNQVPVAATTDYANQPQALGSQGFLQSVVNRAGNALTDKEVQNFQNLAQGNLGRQVLNTDFTQGLGQNAATLQNLANQTRTETGRANLLQQALNQPQYNMGQSTLDSLILGTSAPALRNLQGGATQQLQNYNTALSNLGLNQASARNTVGQDIGTAQKMAQGILTGPSGALPSLKQNILDRVGAAQQAASSNFNDLVNAFQTGKYVDPEKLQAMGVTGDLLNQFNALYSASIAQGQAAAGGGKGQAHILQAGQPIIPPSFDFSKYLSGPDYSKINASTVASTGDYSRYADLNKLANQQGDLLSGTGQLAGSASGIGPQFDIANALKTALPAIAPKATQQQYNDFVAEAGHIDPKVLLGVSAWDPAALSGSASALNKMIAQKNPLVLGNPAIMSAMLAQGFLSGAAKNAVQSLNSQEAEKLKNQLNNFTLQTGNAIGGKTGQDVANLINKGNPITIGQQAAKTLDNVLNEVGHGFDQAGNFISNIFGGGGGGGKIICNELHRQGWISDEIIRLDEAYGRKYRKHYREAYLGYLIVAQPIVNMLRSHPWMCPLMMLLTRPWSQYMANVMESSIPGSITGRVIHEVGIRILPFVYKLKRFSSKKVAM